MDEEILMYSMLRPLENLSMKEAAYALYEDIREHAKSIGHDPDCEVSISPPGKGDYPNTYQVIYEAGPFDLGVNYSLGSAPKSYSWPDIKTDWYLETHYGFDVIFATHDKGTDVYAS